MTRKRFAFHDTSVQSGAGKVTITCSRCPATSTVSKDGETDPVYRALTAIDRQPCAEVELDEHGLPVPAL
jgi:hypothetical protein